MNSFRCALFACLAVSVAFACTPFVETDCANKDVDFVADDCDNKCFYTCAPTGAERRCCNPCELWSQDILTCIFDDSNPTCVFKPTTDFPVCELQVGPNPYTFISNGTVMPCAVGTEYNQTICTCQESTTNPLQMDAQITCITFEEGWNDLQGSNGVYVQSSNVVVKYDCTVAGGNCGYFNASVGSSMTIPLFANTMDAFNAFSLSFFVKRTSGVSGTQGLVDNGVCGVDSSFDVLSGPSSVSSSVRNATDATALSGAEPTTDGQFVHVAVVYDGSSIATYVDGASVAVIPFEGKIKRVYNPMIIGSNMCSPTDFFQGELDTISFAKVAFSPAQVADLAANQGKCLPTV